MELRACMVMMMLGLGGDKGGRVRDVIVNGVPGNGVGVAVCAVVDAAWSQRGSIQSGEG